MKLNEEETVAEEDYKMSDTNLADMVNLRGSGFGLGYGGYGGGLGGYGMGGGMSGGYTNMSAIQHSIEANRQMSENANDNHTNALNSGLSNISDSFENATRSREFTAVNKNISDGNIALNKNVTDGHTAVNKNITDSEFRSLDRQRDTDKTLADMRAENASLAAIALLEAQKCCCDTQKAIAESAKDAAKCCCDAQLAAAKSHAEIMATVTASEGRAIERAFNASQAELVALRTQVACGCCSSPS